MTSSTITTSLPASRTDALSVIIINLLSALIGTLPGEDKGIGLLITTLANVWAILSSALTFQDLLRSPDDMTSHLGLFLVGLLALTSVTSLLLIISLAFKKADNVFKCTFYGTLVAVLVAFVFGLIELILAYVNDCVTDKLARSAFCHHSPSYVIGVAVGAGVGGPICAFILLWCATGCSRKSVKNAFIQLEDQTQNQSTQEPHRHSSILLNRTSALCKVFLLGVYWFLVDADLSWDYTINGYDANLWTTGQWTKHGVAILNTLISCRCS